MAVTHQRIVVSTTAVSLNTPTPGGVRLYIANTTGNAADLGSSTVTAAGGYSLGANATVSIELSGGEQLFAIRSGATDTTLSVVRSGA